MALQKQTITLDFGFGGLDQKTDARRAQPVKFSSLVDVRFSKIGRIETRRAYDTFGVMSSTAIRLFALGDQLMAASQTAGQRAFISRVTDNYSYAMTTLDGYGSRYVDSLPFAEVTTEARGPARNLAVSSTSVVWSRVESNSCVAMAYFSDVGSAFSWFVEIHDKAGGLLRSFSLNTSGGAPYLVAHPDGRDEFVLAHQNGSSNTAYIITPSSTALVAVPTLSITNVAVSGYGWGLAAVADTTASRGAVLAIAGLKSLSIYLKSAEWPATDGTGTAISYTSFNTASQATTLSLASFADPTTPRDFRLAWRISATTIWGATFNRAMTAQFAASAMFNTAATPDQLATVVLGDGTAHVWAGGPTQGTLAVYAINASNTASTVVSNAGGYLMTKMLSAPMGVSNTAGGTSVAWLSRSTTTNQATSYLVAAYETEAVSEVKARAFHLRSWPDLGRYNRPCNAQWSVTDQCVVTSLQRLNRSSTLVGGDSSAGDWGMYDVRAKPVTDGWSTTRWKNELVVSGGYGFVLNGIDAPIPTAPLMIPTIALASVTSAGGALTAGSYQVSGFFEHTDNQGMVRRSETAEPLTVTLSGTQVAFAVTVSNYTIPDGLPGRVRFVATRTLVNGAQVYYRDVSYSTTSTTSAIAVSFTAADATIAAREPMYTTGGVFDDSAASCLLTSATNGRRMLAVFGDDPNFVVETKPSGAFMEGVGRRVDAGGSRIYALASYLDRWFVFKKDGIFIATGDGADVRGQKETLSEFETLTHGLGCTSPRSVLVTSAGIVFLSDRGFYLIGPDLSPRYIGADVEDFTSEAKVNATSLVDACYDPVGATAEDSGARDAGDNSSSRIGATGERCVFVFRGDGITSSADSETLVLTILSAAQGVDLRWSKDSRIGTNGQTAAVVSLPKYNGGRIVASVGSSIVAESDEDSSSEYQTAIDSPALQAITSWVPMGGVQGFGRIYKSSIIGALPVGSNTSTTVTVAVGYDYSPNFSETHTIQIGAMQNGEFEFGNQRTRCEAVRYRISQTSDTTTPGFMPAQIQVTVGVKGTTNKLPASARARKV